MSRPIHKSPLFTSVAAAIVIGIAGSAIYFSLAATASPAVEAESALPGTTGVQPQIIDDPLASGNKALAFLPAPGHPGTIPPPKPSPNPSPSPSPNPPPATNAQPEGTAAGPWTMTFNDEFDGTSLDTTKWKADTQAGNNPDETACFDPSAVTVSGGSLDIALTNQSCQGKQNTGGQIGTTSFQQVHGYYEARMNLPGSNGRTYNFPAFWIVPNGSNSPCWPTGGEMDVMETIGGGAKASYGFGNSCDNVSNNWPHADPGGGDWTGWHTFGVDWEPGTMTVYYDGKQIGQPINDEGTTTPMNVIIDNVSRPMGGETVTGTSIKVDYVRVWKH